MNRHKTISLFARLAAFSVFVLGASAAYADFDSKVKAVAAELEEIPILHEGRVKPLDTFARANLLAFQQKSKLRHEGLTAMEWLTELMLFPDQAYDRKIFKVRTPSVLNALNISVADDGNYSFSDLSRSLDDNLDTLRKLSEKERDDLDPTERQLLDLYFKTIAYLDVSRSLTGLIRDVEITDESLASELGVAYGQKVSYFEMLPARTRLSEKIQGFRDMSEEEKSTPESVALMGLVRDLGNKLRDRASQSLKMMTPAEGQMKNLWISPWTALDGADQTDRTLRKVEALSQLVHYAQNGNIEKLQDSVATFTSFFEGDAKLGLEVSYSKADYFYYSLIFYVLSCLLMWISFAFLPRALYKASFWSMAIGLGFHVVGMTVRCIVMSRPPVTTLYETFIFVGAIAIIAALILELVTKNALGLFVGPIIGVVLHFIGIKYAVDDGDSMGILVAVLDSNFWLSTHVTTINIGYGCAGFAGMVAHGYLAIRAFRPELKDRAKEYFNICIGLSFVAVFFTTFGTILGGIWGDQSWGRFWGWDPKENGALLIVLSILAILHARMAGLIKAFGMCMSAILCGMVVAFSWWGVNLLGIGLHSYGFTSGIMSGLMIFYGIEGSVMLAGVYAWLRDRPKPKTSVG